MGPKKSRDFATTKKRVTGSSNLSPRPGRKTSSSSQIPSAYIDSTSEESKANATEESSVEEHRRKNLEWHETRQIENFKRAQERRAKEREEKNLELVLSPDKNGTSDSTTSESEDDVVTTDPEPTKRTLKPPSDVECQLLKRVKPFSQLPRELWEKRVQPTRKKAVPLPPPIEQNQTDSEAMTEASSNKQQEVGSTKKNVGGFQPTHIEGEGEHDNENGSTFSINRDSRKSVRTTESPAVQHASKRQRVQLDTPEDVIRTQYIDSNEESFTNKKLFTSTPFPSKPKTGPLAPGMSPVTPQSDNRPYRNVIHTQKVKTQTKIPVRVGVLARKNAAQSLESPGIATPSQPKLSTQDRMVTDPPDSGNSNGLHPKPTSITAQKNTTFDVSHGFGSGRPRVERTPLLHPSSAQAKQRSNDSSSNEDDEDPHADIPKADLVTAENRPSSRTLSTSRIIQEPLRGNSEQQRELQYQSVEVAPPPSVTDKRMSRSKKFSRTSNALLAADVSSDSEEDALPVPGRTISITRPRPIDSPTVTTGRNSSSQIHRVSSDQKESEGVIQPWPRRTTITNKTSVAPLTLSKPADVQEKCYSRPRSTSLHNNSVKQKPPPSHANESSASDMHQSDDGSDPEENEHALATTLPMHKSPKSSKQPSPSPIVPSQQLPVESSSEEEDPLKNASRKPSIIISTRGARKESSTNLPAPPPSEVLNQSQNSHNESDSDSSTSATPPPLQQQASVVRRATLPLPLSQSRPENNLRLSTRQMQIQEHEDERSVGQPPADASVNHATSESEEEKAPRKLRKTGGARVKTAKVAPAPKRKPTKKPAVALPALRTSARNKLAKSVHHTSHPPPPSEVPNQSQNKHNDSDSDCSSTSTSAPAPPPLPHATSPLPLSQSRPEYNVRLSSRQMSIQEHKDKRSVGQPADASGDNSTSESEEEEAPRKLRKTGGAGVETAKVTAVPKRKPKKKPAEVLPAPRTRARNQVEKPIHHPSPPSSPTEVFTPSQDNHNESDGDSCTAAPPQLPQATSPLPSPQSRPENNVRVSSRQMSMQRHDDDGSAGQPADASGTGNHTTSESKEEEAPVKLRGRAGSKKVKATTLASKRKPKKKPAVALPALRTRARNQSEKSVHLSSPPPPPSDVFTQSQNSHNESDSDKSTSAPPRPLQQRESVGQRATSPVPLSQSRPENNVHLSSRQMSIQEHEDKRSEGQPPADGSGNRTTSESEEEEAPRKLRKTRGAGVETAKVAAAPKRKPKKKPAVVLPALRTRARNRVEKSVHHTNPPPPPSEVQSQNNHNESESDSSASAPPPLQQRASIVQRATSPLPLSQTRPENNVRLSSRQMSIQENEDERSVEQPADASGDNSTSKSEGAPRKLRETGGAGVKTAKVAPAPKRKPKKKPAVVLPALRTRARSQVEKSIHHPSPPPPQILDHDDESERQNERLSSTRQQNPDRKSYSNSQPAPASTTTVDKTFNRGARMSLSQPVRLTEATSSQPLSQHSIRSRESHRRSVFEVARATSIIAMSRKDTTATNAAKRGRGPRKEEPTERYVGNDIFGNYQIMKSEDVAKILNEEKPNHGLDEEHAAQLSVRVNHFLEDFFTHHCEDTPQPYGFMTFQNLKTAMVEQCLLEDDATADDLMQEMKKSFSKEDWKRSEGVLYPSRYSNKEDTADYYFK